VEKNVMEEFAELVTLQVLKETMQTSREKGN